MVGMSATEQFAMISLTGLPLANVHTPPPHTWMIRSLVVGMSATERYAMILLTGLPLVEAAPEPSPLPAVRRRRVSSFF